MMWGDINNDNDINLLDIVFYASHLDVDISGNRPDPKYDIVYNDDFNNGLSGLADFVNGKIPELSKFNIIIRQIDNVTEYIIPDTSSKEICAAKLIFENDIDISGVDIPSDWKVGIRGNIALLYSSVRNSIGNKEWSMLFRQNFTNNIDVSGDNQFVTQDCEFFQKLNVVINNGYLEPEPEPEPQPEPEPEIYNVFLDKNVLQTAVYEWATMDNAEVLSQYGPINEWNVSAITDMSDLFYDTSGVYSSFNEDISGWDTSNVESMDLMFGKANSFNKPIGNWNVESVTSMFCMFYYAASFNQDISSWNVSKVTSMGAMFRASSFNQPLNSWDVSEVSNMQSMFRTSSFNYPLNSWNVSSVTRMDYMFNDMLFNQDIGIWNVSGVTKFNNMFHMNTVFNNGNSDSIQSWSTSNANDMKAMFRYAQSFNQPLNSWDVSSVTNMEGMFYNAEVFDQSLGDWDISNVNSTIDFAKDTNISTNNYSSILVGWEKLATLSLDIAGNSIGFSSKYNEEGWVARTKLLSRLDDNFTWDDEGFDVSGESLITSHGDSDDGPYSNGPLEFTISGVETIDIPIQIGDGWKVGDYEETYVKVETTDNEPVTTGFYGENDSISSLDISGAYIVKIYLPTPDLNDSGETWGVYFHDKNITSNSSLNITNLNGIVLYSDSKQFKGFAGRISATDAPSIRTGTSLDSAFENSTFQGHKDNETTLNLSNWNVSGITTTKQMFNVTPDLGNNFDVIIENWDLNNSDSCQQMFHTSFGYNLDNYIHKTISLKGWNLTNNLYEMFRYSYYFDGDVSNWTITNPSSFYALFDRCYNFKGTGLSSWIVSSPNQIQYYSMEGAFSRCFQLGNGVDINISEGLNSITGWDYTYCSSLKNAFNGCVRLGKNDFIMNNCNLINLAEANNCQNTFRYSFGSTQTTLTSWEENANLGDVSDYTDSSGGIVELKNWKLNDDVNGVDCEDMFAYSYYFDGDISNWTITNPNSFYKTFSYCWEFKGTGLSSLTISSPNQIQYSMHEMFLHCFQLGNGVDINISHFTPLLSYDATGTNFNGIGTADTLRTASNAIDLSSTYDISRLTGTASRTIIATFNTNIGDPENDHVIVGYGTGSSHGDRFALKVSNTTSKNGGDASGGVYALGFWGGGGPDFWLDANIGTVSAGVETIAAVSWDGTNIYLFLKNSSTGQWVMDSNAEPGINTGTTYGLMIGAFPLSSTQVRQSFNGTIGQVEVYDFAVTNIEGLNSITGWDYTYCSSLQNAFNGCVRLGKNDFIMNNCNLINLAEANNCQNTFKYSFGSTHATIIDLGAGDVSDYTDSSGGIVELKNWKLNDDVNGVDCEGMFANSYYFDGDISNWTITNPNSFYQTFSYCWDFKGTGLSSLTISSPNQIQYSMHEMFLHCFQLGNGVDINISHGGHNVFQYDATGTTFDGVHENSITDNSDAIDLSDQFDVSEAGLLGNADRTIIATINLNPYEELSAWTMNIMGYGGYYENKSFMIRILNPGSGSYYLGVAGYSNDHRSTLKISANVETTFAISLDGVGDGTNSIAHFFLLEPATSTWQMETVVLPNGQYNTELGEGFMIGGYPSSSTNVRHAYRGTIGKVEVYDFAVTNIEGVSSLTGWDYTYCSSLKNAFNGCVRLGKNDFIMNNCNLINLAVADNCKNTFKYSFGSTHNTINTVIISAGADDVSDYTDSSGGIVELKNWKLNDDVNGVDCYTMFAYSYYFDGDISNWTITNPNSFYQTFTDCWDFKGTGLNSLTISSPNQIQYSMYRMFFNCYELGNGVDINISDVREGGTIDYSWCEDSRGLFENCARLGMGADFIMEGCNFNICVDSREMFENAFGKGIESEYDAKLATPLFSYDATSTIFDGTGTNAIRIASGRDGYGNGSSVDCANGELGFDIRGAGILRNSPRTIIVTFNANWSTPNTPQIIFGYGIAGSKGRFALKISNSTSYNGGDASGGVYGLCFWGSGAGDYWLDPNIGTVSAGVETTVAVSYDGTDIYLFLKNHSTGVWIMDSAPRDINTGNNVDFMIGAWAISANAVDISATATPFSGTIGQLSIYNFSCSSIEDLPSIKNNNVVSLQNWNIKNANTKHLFLRAVRFDGDVSNWTITNPISLEQMFYNCYIFSGKGLSSWNIVTDSTYKDKGFQADDMFYACYELGRNVDIDLSSQARYKSFLDVYNYGNEWMWNRTSSITNTEISGISDEINGTWMRQKICDNHGGDITFSTSLDFSSTHSVCFDANAPRISSLLWYGNGSTNKTLLTNLTNNISQTSSRDISNSSELKIDIKFNNIPNDFGTLNSASFSGGSIEAFGYDISDVSDSGNYIASYTDGNYIKMCKVDSSGQTVSNSGKFFVAEDETGAEYDGHCGTIINTLDKLITLYNAGEINNGSEYVFTPGSTFKAIPPNVFYRARTSVNVSGWPKLSGGQWGALPGPVLVRDVVSAHNINLYSKRLWWSNGGNNYIAYKIISSKLNYSSGSNVIKFSFNSDHDFCLTFNTSNSWTLPTEDNTTYSFMIVTHSGISEHDDKGNAYVWPSFHGRLGLAGADETNISDLDNTARVLWASGVNNYSGTTLSANKSYTIKLQDNVLSLHVEDESGTTVLSPQSSPSPTAESGGTYDVILYGVPDNFELPYFWMNTKERSTTDPDTRTNNKDSLNIYETFEFELPCESLYYFANQHNFQAKSIKVESSISVLEINNWSDSWTINGDVVTKTEIGYGLDESRWDVDTVNGQWYGQKIIGYTYGGYTITCPMNSGVSYSICLDEMNPRTAGILFASGTNNDVTIYANLSDEMGTETSVGSINLSDEDTLIDHQYLYIDVLFKEDAIDLICRTGNYVGTFGPRVFAPPTVINIHTNGTWKDVYEYVKAEESNGYVRYQLHWKIEGDPGAGDAPATAEGIVFELDTNNNLILDVENPTYGSENPSFYSRRVSGGYDWNTESSGKGVVTIGDEIQLWSVSTLLGHITVPNPNYLCDISISAENLNYSINGVYYCEMGSSVSGKRDISINNYSDATGGNTNAGFNMNKCLSVSDMFTYCWELGYGGNMTLNNWNLENCGYMQGMLQNATGKDKQVEMNDDFNYTTKFLIKAYDEVEKTTTYFSDNSQKTEFLTEGSGITNRALDWYDFEILKINPKPKSNYQPTETQPGDRCFFTHEFKITWTQLNDDDDFTPANEPNSQHGGYYLDYIDADGNTAFAASANNQNFLRDNGPHWWWGSAGNRSFFTRTDGGSGTTGGCTEFTIDEEFRKSHSLTFKFVDNTTWSVTFEVNGNSYTSYMCTTLGDTDISEKWTFTDKESIHLYYFTHNAQFSPHEITLERKVSQSLNNWNIGPCEKPTWMSASLRSVTNGYLNPSVDNWSISNAFDFKRSSSEFFVRQNKAGHRYNMNVGSWEINNSYSVQGNNSEFFDNQKIMEHMWSNYVYEDIDGNVYVDINEKLLFYASAEKQKYHRPKKNAAWLNGYVWPDMDVDMTNSTPEETRWDNVEYDGWNGVKMFDKHTLKLNKAIDPSEGYIYFIWFYWSAANAGQSKGFFRDNGRAGVWIDADGGGTGSIGIDSAAISSISYDKWYFIAETENTSNGIKYYFGEKGGTSVQEFSDPTYPSSIGVTDTIHIAQDQTTGERFLPIHEVFILKGYWDDTSIEDKLLSRAYI